MDKNILLESSRLIIDNLRTREQGRFNELFNLDSKGLESICGKIADAKSDEEVLGVLETEYRDFLDSAGSIRNPGLIDNLDEVKKLNRSIESLLESLDQGSEVFSAAEHALGYLHRYKNALQDVLGTRF